MSETFAFLFALVLRPLASDALFATVVVVVAVVLVVVDDADVADEPGVPDDVPPLELDGGALSTFTAAKSERSSFSDVTPSA